MQTLLINPPFTKKHSRPKAIVNESFLPEQIRVNPQSKAHYVRECVFYGEMYWRLIDLIMGYEKDPELRASEESFNITMRALFETAKSLGDEFPDGYAYTDAEGGICIEWHNGQKEVLLTVPHPDKGTPSIYKKDKAGKAYDHDLSKLPERLSEIAV